MKRENRSITFRIGNNIFGGLSDESKRKQMSLNTLVNQILQEHLDWHTDAAKAGQVPIAKGLITSLMNRLDDKEIIKFAKESISVPKETVLLLRTEFTVQKAIEVYESWIRAAGFPYTMNVNGSEYRIVVQHDMGTKWSLFLSELSKNVYQSLGAQIETAITDNTLLVKIINT